MKKQLAVGSLIAGGALLACFIIAGNAEARGPRQVPSADPPAPSAETPIRADDCHTLCNGSSQGYFVCPDDNTEWDYSAVRECVDCCGTLGIKSVASTACNNYCNATCVAHEWFACVL